MSDPAPTIREAVRRVLLDNAEVAAVVEQRVHYHKKTQTPRDPSVVIVAESRARRHHMQGRAGSASGVVRVYSFAADTLAAENLADLVSKALAGFHGVVDLGSGRELQVHYFKHQDTRELGDPPPEGSESPYAGFVSDFTFAAKAD